MVIENDVTNTEKVAEEVVHEETVEVEVKKTALVVTPSKEIDNIISLDEMMNAATLLVNSSLVPFKKPEDVVVAWQFGRELGISFTRAMNELYPIDTKAGKRVTAGVHVHEALLLQSGKIKYQVIEDAVEVSHFLIQGMGKIILSMKEVQAKVEDGTYQIVLQSDFSADGKLTVPKVGKYLILKTSSEFMPSNISDRRTRIRFIREDRGIDECVDYYLHEAFQAGYMNKSNWQQQLVFMMYTRCFTKGSNRYASDINRGLKEITEIADSNNVKYSMNDNHQVKFTEDTTFEEVID